MSSRLMCGVAILLIAGFLSGCLVIDAGREMWKQTVKVLTPDPSGYNDGIDESESDPLFSSWDKQAHGLRPVEKGAGDPLLSAKARQIERNLGAD